MNDADNVVELFLVGGQPRVIAVGQLLREQRRLGRQVDSFDQAARRHHIIDADRIEIEEVREHGPMLAAKELTLEHQRAQLLLREGSIRLVDRSDREHPQQGLDE
ncbi:MAG: hypothetical protein E6H78_15200 [Betaproteobacteria bacterium]|nr:MAG: hypothetical protein E6H78_15200 [Betaproteobacteria bacterium]